MGTVGKWLQGEHLSDSDIDKYNDVIAIGTAKTPVHLSCSEHKSRQAVLYGIDDDPAPHFVSTPSGFRCVECSDDASTTAREIARL